MKGRSMKPESITLEESIIELYLSVKIRKKEEIEKLTPEDLMNEKQNLKKMNLIHIVEYIKGAFEILINLKVEERFEQEKNKLIASQSSFNSSLNDLIINNQNVRHNLPYEKIIADLEGKVHNYIKSEQLLKLQLDNLQAKYNYLDRKFEETIKSNESKGLDLSCRVLAGSTKSRDKSRDENRGSHNYHNSSRIISNPINYNFNNPIVIYGSNRIFQKKSKEEENDTVNYQQRQQHSPSADPRSHSTNSKVSKNYQRLNNDYLTTRLNKKKDISPFRTHTPISNYKARKMQLNTINTNDLSNLSNISTIKTTMGNRNTNGNNTTMNCHFKNKSLITTKKNVDIQIGLKKLNRANILSNLNNLQVQNNGKSKQSSNTITRAGPSQKSKGKSSHYRANSVLYTKDD